MAAALLLWVGLMLSPSARAEQDREEASVSEEKETSPNRLIKATSPYLRQHAHNPVDWYPWGEEALAKARDEDKPIFLSIGYSACHWCHVMERESFENDEIAALMNQFFVNVKVDREERPDLDEIYMNAVIALAGQGGWPMSVFLTPTLKPFYGGTYYPPRDMQGRPGFPTVLLGVAKAWSERRDEVLATATDLTGYVKSQLTHILPPEGTVGVQLLDAAAKELANHYDAVDGGWGGAPKFPSSASVALLFRHSQRSGDEHGAKMALHTLESMANGGIYDHLGGGFHRYSVDGQWLVPHFEKMLYDNAQLAPVYIEAWQLTGNRRFAEVAEEIYQYVLRDMQGPDGGFYSSEDADSEGKEGIFYTWRADEIDEVLNPDDAALFKAAYTIQRGGNFSSHEPYHASENIPHRSTDWDELAKIHDLSLDELKLRLAPMKETLLAHRNKRVRPGLDDKIITAWNGMMISALCQGYRALGDVTLRDSALRAARFAREHLHDGADLYRTHRAGASQLPAYLDDYAWLATAYLDCYEASYDRQWLDEAKALANRMNTHFWDSDNGLFWYTGEQHDNLIVRARPTYDGAEPSGNSIAAMLLLRLAAHLDSDAYRERALQMLEAAQGYMSRGPRGYLRMLLSLDAYLHPGWEVVLAGDPAAIAFQEMERILGENFLPNGILAHLPEDDSETTKSLLFLGKTAIEGKPTAYLCRNYACEHPITHPEELRERLEKKNQ